MWAFIHNVVSHPLMAVFSNAEWTVRFHDWTARLAWPDDE